MILANGCSHTHGTAHAIHNGYADKLWPNIAGKVLGDTTVVNLAKGGDSAGAIADSTIHWLETNTIKPDMVMIQWTYADLIFLITVCMQMIHLEMDVLLIILD